MACCIALAMLIAVVRGAWTAILPRRRRNGPQDFAPAAHRPAPAETVASEEQCPGAHTSSDASVAVHS